ncbi:4'-phosphopantetheinyl transferase family protein [Paraferrimonas haliotis]|uniref:4'-phosphopantetheinyl transferase domain-containing protein n=1 Tax=Paraferrimonas haliotis TaxID=2013866 RepID=A0AA37WX67_9GAMM|nr:4'-phosphopantetheinyl transferase superfamily protein [Paraferrimonas haliotis]GLS83179.1 hypothetical protein GCM10007894_11560 [Paraferrimonas haliotis]
MQAPLVALSSFDKTLSRPQQQMQGNQLLATLLERHWQRAVSPDSIGRNQHGAPTLDDGNLHLSLSHSGEHLVAAVYHQPLGVDIEFMNPNRNHQGIWDYIRHPQEPQAITDIAQFYRYWTTKEAAWKCAHCQSPSRLSLLGVCDDALALDCGLTVQPLAAPNEYAMTLVYQP